MKPNIDPKSAYQDDQDDWGDLRPSARKTDLASVEVEASRDPDAQAKTSLTRSKTRAHQAALTDAKDGRPQNNNSVLVNAKKKNI